MTKYNCRTHKGHYDSFGLLQYVTCRKCRTCKTVYRQNINASLKMNEGTHLAWDSIFLGNMNSRKLRRRFKESSLVRSGNEVGIGVNDTFVTPCAMSWFCLPWICLRPEIKWSWRTWCCLAFRAIEVYMSCAVAAGAAYEELWAQFRVHIST